MPEHASELQVVSRRSAGWRRYDESGKRALVAAVLRPGIYELLKNKGAPRPRLCVPLIVR
jgi:hypothetical protein